MLPYRPPGAERYTGSMALAVLIPEVPLAAARRLLLLRVRLQQLHIILETSMVLVSVQIARALRFKRGQLPRHREVQVQHRRQ